MRRKVVVPLVAAVALALTGIAGLWWWRAAQTTDLERALGHAPGDAVRYAWTDWAGIRNELGADDLAGLLDEGFVSDVISTSAMVSSAEALDEVLGLSPATVSWELLAQSEQGSVVVLGVKDVDALEERLAGAGWRQAPDEGEVWSGDPGELAQREVAAQFTHIRADRSAGVVFASDQAAYLASDEDGALDEGLLDTANAVGEPLSAVLLGGRQTCSELAMAHAGPEDQQVAEELVRDAGPVSPVSGYALAALPGGSARAVLAFESGEQAEENADTRAALASGPAPGQGGSFRDRFRLGEVRAEGRVVTLEMTPVDGAYVVSDLGSGPVLFATC